MNSGSDTASAGRGRAMPKGTISAMRVGRRVSSSTWSARKTASSRSCETMSMVTPVSIWACCTFSRMDSVISKSSALKGSSKNSTSGRGASARMMDAVCCCPPDSSYG
jgi:hypothetical protein